VPACPHLAAIRDRRTNIGNNSIESMISMRMKRKISEACVADQFQVEIRALWDYHYVCRIPIMGWMGLSRPSPRHSKISKAITGPRLPVDVLAFVTHLHEIAGK